MEELPDLRIQRPYATLDEYLEGDFWTVERKEMFLIGAAPLEQGVAVKFTIELADGTPVVTGEGRVVEHMAHSDEFPGGLKVRFRQLDNEAKAVLRRALELRRAYAAAMAEVEAAAAPAEAVPAPAHDAAPAAVSAPTFAAESAPLPAPSPASPPSPTSPSSTFISSSASPTPPRPSQFPPPKPRGSRARSTVRVVAAPPNRDALLGRLRERARGFSSASAGPRLP
jgi:hypothetical protein